MFWVDTSCLFPWISSSARSARRSPAMMCSALLVHLNGFGNLIVMRQIAVDRDLEVIHAGIAAAADAYCGDLGEEAFHQAQPRGAG